MGKPNSFTAAVEPFLVKNCLACHSAKARAGGLDLQRYHDAADRDLWEKVVLKVRTGEMPPKGFPKPPEAATRAVVAWLEKDFERQDAALKPDPGRVTARRLNRFEYNNTIRDLLGVDFKPADDFPADDSGYGFDNIGDVLSLSPVLMEKYLAAADRIARLAVSADKFQVKATRERFEAERLFGANRDARPAVGPALSRMAMHALHEFPAQGQYDARLQLGGIRPGAPKVRVAFFLDGNQIEVFEVDPERNQKRTFDLKLNISAGPHMVGAAAVDDNSFDPAQYPITPRDRYLMVESIELRGPFQAVPPPLPPSHVRIIACGHAAGAHDAACARKVIDPLARRAWRRPVSEAELKRLAKFVEMAQSEGDSFEQGIRLALKAILVSPHFLFRIERDPDPNDPAAHQISAYELASRLSYFLWSSMPDDELLRLAGSGGLTKPPILRAQVRRMLRDAKSSALADNFASQWLQIRNLESVTPDPDKFPEFDEELRDAMQQETRLFFNALLREDRSILEFLDSRFTYLNERLAQHYGIAGVEGDYFRRVPLTGGQRGGVLTQASVLTVSSYPTRTSPVMRGKFILENLLNAPPPPPPPGVANLDESAIGLTGSLREQLEKHRADPTCASCHARMDPLGFGLENYDAIGRWRSSDGKFPIDVAGKLPDGQTFATPADLKLILKSDRDAFAQCLAEKLLTYALGRGLERFDKPAIRLITKNLSLQQYRFSRLIEEIVRSMPFQMRRGESKRT